MTNQQAAKQWQLTCQCGWRVKGTREAVVDAVQAHGREAHDTELTEDQVMSQAVPSDEA